jgi:hypothetical protein
MHDLQFLELRVGHVTPDRGVVHHCRSDYRSIDRYFVLCGQLASPANQRIKFFTNNMSASFRVLDLSVESEVIVEFDSVLTSIRHKRNHVSRLSTTLWSRCVLTNA